MEIADMSYFDRFIAGLNLIREYVKHESLEPEHDVINVWTDYKRVVPEDVIARLEEYHWYHDEEDTDRFYFFT